MTIAQAVKRPDSPDGPPICGPGTLLTELLIDRFDLMGVKSITVEGHPVQAEGEETFEEQLSSLDRRFKHLEGNKDMMMLKDIFKKVITEAAGDYDK